MINLSIWITMRSCLQFPMRVFPQRTELIYEALASARALGIRYALPPQPVRLDNPTGNAIRIALAQPHSPHPEQ